MTEQHPPPWFIADAPALDFLNSIATPTDTPVEWIGSGAGLLDWLGAARFVPDDVCERFRADAVPGELDAVAAQARALREWFRSFVQAHKGRPLAPGALAALAPLNQILARDEQYHQIVARDAGDAPDAPSGLAWRTNRRWRSPDSLLIPIARSMAELVCTEDFTQVKACEGHACTLTFLDRTRGRQRRWCSMAVCGNRAKAQAHRARARAANRAQKEVG